MLELLQHVSHMLSFTQPCRGGHSCFNASEQTVAHMLHRHVPGRTDTVPQTLPGRAGSHDKGVTVLCAWADLTAERQGDATPGTEPCPLSRDSGAGSLSRLILCLLLGLDVLDLPVRGASFLPLPNSTVITPGIVSVKPFSA